MFTKVLSFILAFSILNTTAYASSNAALTEAINEVEFSINVLWDQKDQNFYDQEIEKFNNKIVDLMNEGVEPATIFEQLNARVPDQRLASELKQAYNVIQLSKLSKEDATKLFLDVANQGSQRGANWSGSGEIIIAGLIVVGMLIVLGMDISEECETCPGGKYPVEN